MLIKYTGKYVKIYFIMKITYLFHRTLLSIDEKNGFSFFFLIYVKFSESK